MQFDWNDWESENIFCEFACKHLGNLIEIYSTLLIYNKEKTPTKNEVNKSRTTEEGLFISG